MSQSEQHWSLVTGVVKALAIRFPATSFVADLQQNPGDPVPPLINGYRPDVISKNNSGDLVIIAECKTNSDLDNRHAENQIASFINYLEERGNGRFVLSVSGYGANRAKTILRSMHQSGRVTETALMVYDGWDFWLLESTRGISWHLD